MRQLTEVEWGEQADPHPVCTLPFTPVEFSARWPIEFVEYRDDRLGLCAVTAFEAGGHKYLAEAQPKGPEEARYLTIFVPSNEPDSKLALAALLQELEITSQQLRWASTALGAASWHLYRTDDNGNEILVDSFQSKASADWIRTMYERRGHKQVYLVSNERREL